MIPKHFIKIKPLKYCIQFSVGLLLVLFSYFANAQSINYLLNNDASSVSFATIKKQYVIEPAYFQKVTGKISNEGELTINIHLNTVKTGIPIRDQRLQHLFFITQANPLVTIKADLDMSKINQMRGSIRKYQNAKVNLNGTERTIMINVIITKIGGKIFASTVKPIIVNANDFGIPANNLIALAKTVGGITISPIVPVSFSLLFE